MEFSIKAGAEFDRLARRLREAGERDLQRELQQALEKGANKIAEAQKRTVKSLPTHGRKHTGLRARVAKEVRVQVQTSAYGGVRIVEGKTSALGNLPAHMNAGSWRHPVFGNREIWRTQKIAPGWFYFPAHEHSEWVRIELEKAMKSVADKIGGI